MKSKLLVVEKHRIKKHSKHFKEVDNLSFLAKNLYNSTLYILRNQWFSYLEFKKLNNNLKFNWITYPQLCKQFAQHNQKDYRALPAKVSQQVMKTAFANFSSYVAAAKQYGKTPQKFLGAPKLPKYKDKIKGRQLLIYTSQAISKKDVIKLSKTNIFINVQTKNKIHQIRIIPSGTSYTLEIVYERYCKKIKNKNNKIASIDVGVNNLAAITTNCGQQPLLIPGGPVKSINHYYNKNKADLQSYLSKTKRRTSNKIQKLTDKRNNKVNDYLHKSSRFIVNYLVSQNIQTLIIGKNINWKQKTNIGKTNNQNFVMIPFARFINMLEYKCKLNGIKVILQEESYTSKCSFLDKEKMQKQNKYAGKRIKRGLFKSKNNKIINADLNGSANIMRKAIPKVKYSNGIEAVVVQPRRLKPSKNNKWFI